MTKIVDDSLLWSKDVATNFYETCNYLDLCGRNGIVLNPSKFELCKKEVEFAGFQVRMETIKPCTKIMKSIAEFTIPKTIADVTIFCCIT